MENRKQLIQTLWSGSHTISREDARQNSELGPFEKMKLFYAHEALDHPEFQQLIDDGLVTLGGVKPHAEESRLGETSDTIAEKKILNLISPPLQLIFQVSVNLNQKDVDTIYEEVKTRIPTDEWERFSNFMQSGPTTYFILYDRSGTIAGNAVEEWRRQMGATDPAQATPDSIRGRFGLNRMSNLVHGAATPEDVKKETAWLSKKILSLI